MPDHAPSRHPPPFSGPIVKFQCSLSNGVKCVYAPRGLKCSGSKENNKTRCGVPKGKTTEKYESYRSQQRNIERKTAIEQKAKTQKG